MNEEKIPDISMVIKSASVESQELTDAELRAINKLALSPLTKEEVFTFKVAMCDNEVDREYEVFPLKTLQTLSKMYVGKTVIKDHNHKADNQVARIYSVELVQDGTKTTKNGELYTQLVAHCYMLNSESNKDLIAEIKAGIKKEVSVACSCGSAVCSVCGTDNRKDYCNHYWGKEYDGKMCYFKLENAKDAYELSFVAVPAQKNAGTIKKYGAVYKEFDEKQDNIEKQQETEKEASVDFAKNVVDEKELNTRIRLLNAQLFLNEREER